MAEEEKKEKPQLPKSEVRTPDKVSVKNGSHIKGGGDVNIGKVTKSNF
ncbi:hypothetical protein SAMN05444360_109142 [Chryseobacterium carnipullorum]|nr:hypothetical protein [Chryseobacterium carnipullorum]SHM24090.1 hypothetical protein SAMN05444360_109142 [Chryseobacterium carnipullorum]